MGHNVHRIKSLVLVAAVGVSAPAFAETAKKDPPAAKKDPKAAAAKKEKPAPPKKIVPVSAEKKKVLAELYGGFKFGMSKDDVIKILSKQLDDRYDQQIKATTDVAAQDRLRKDRKAEVSRISASYVTFEGKKTGWDVSIVEDEFAHKTDESMLERWENKDGKNQRRFFFFHGGKLWKMFVSLDVSILPADKQNFETFQGVMTAKYGPGNIEPTQITWHTDEFDVHAVDKLKAYSTLALVIEEPRVKKELVALRESKADKKPETNSVIKAVIDPDHTDKPDVKQNSNAVDTVIKSNNGGGTAPPPKKKIWSGSGWLRAFFHVR
ncbi:MAG: hypothetical protein ABI867_32650 [Kofleriaceae bacterium]